MGAKIITTKSGTEYRFDPDAATVTWTAPDGTAREYTDVKVGRCVVGNRFIYAGTRDIDGELHTRSTTPVVSIDEDVT